MGRFILRRALQSLLIFMGVMTIVFFLIRVIGNPAVLMLPPGSSEEDINRLSEQLGLNDPLIEQYLRFISGLFRGDLGQSFWTNRPVIQTVLEFFPATLLLASVTVSFALVAGVLLGTLAGAREGSRFERFLNYFFYICISTPEFWFGLVLISVLAVQLGLLPTSGYGGWKHMVLPVLTLAYSTIGKIAQTTQVALREELAKEYVFVAQAKGLSHWRVIWHALRNSLLGVITLAGDEVAALVAGAVTIEVIFAWPGIGFLSIQAIERRDANLVVGVVIAVAAFTLLLNFVIDILYRVIDPRIEVR